MIQQFSVGQPVASSVPPSSARSPNSQDPDLPFESLLMAESTISKLLRRTFSCLVSEQLDRRAVRFSVARVGSVVCDLARFAAARKDPGESALQTSGWSPSLEPVLAENWPRE